jgi:hypothetical protein
VNARVETRAEQTPADPISDEYASAGKALAVLLYNVGARTEAETMAAFAAHAEWWSA